MLKIRDPAGLPSYMHQERQIFSMQFVMGDSRLNFYTPGNPVHSWYTAVCNPGEEECGSMFSNAALITNEGLVHTTLEVGMPFHGLHFHDLVVDEQSVPVCRNSYLALGITRCVNGSSDQPDAFIVQGDRRVHAAGCAHGIHLDEGRTLVSWNAVGLLAGWRKGASSLGTVVAVSPDGSRIAAATWSRVLIWSFNPGLLHQGELQHYFPQRDYNERKGFGRLRPTLLPWAGVIYSMLWLDEAHLYATTDRGLIKWDVGHMSRGEREGLTLTYDAWPDTAIAVSAMAPRLSRWK